MTTKEWRLKNPQKTLEQHRRYRAKNRVKINAYAKQWRLRNPEKYNAKQKRYDLKNPDRRKNKQYGINLAEMKKKQNGMCAICSRKVFLVIDHCHQTKKFRGLLCNDCNLGLGRFFDSVENLEKAKKYLLDFQEKLTLNI